MYNELMQKPGKRIAPEIYYFNGDEKIILENDKIKSIKPNFKAKLIGTVMKGLEIETTQELPNISIYFKNTVTYGKNSDSKIIGPYYLKEKPTYNADSKTYSHDLYDEFLNTMVDYKPIKITYPTTVIEFFKQLCIECGFTTDIVELPNGNRIIQSDIYEGIDYTYRDVYEDIGQATGTLFGVNGNIIIKISLGMNEVIINDDLLKNQNIETKEHFGPINCVYLSRAGDSDKIYQRDESLTEWNEFTIKDNQLMNENNRSDYLPELYNALHGIEYDIFDFELIGYGGFDVLQKIKIETGDNVYNSYVFNDEEEYTQGYTESIYAELPEENENNYKTSDTTDKRINQAYIIVRKQEKEIEALASSVVDLIETKHSIGLLEINSNFETTAFELKIRNACEVFSHNQLFGSDDLHGKDSWLKITYEDNTSERVYLPILSLRNFSGVYDELNIKSGKVSITKRIGVNENNEPYILKEEQTTEYEDKIILLKKGKNTFELESFPEATFDIAYMINNIYSDTFATEAQVQAMLKVAVDNVMISVDSKAGKEELKSSIEAAIKEINLEVSKKITKEDADNLIKESEEKTKETTDALSKELEGKIDETKANELIDEKTNPLSTSINDIDTKYQNAVNDINKEMGTKIGEEDFTGAQIILKINGDESEVLISGDKINLVAEQILNLLAGNAINLTSKDITVESEDLTINKNGNIELRDNSDGTFENTTASLSVKNIIGNLDAKYTSLGALLKNSLGFETSLTAQSMFMFYNDNSIMIGSENPLISISDGTDGVLITPSKITSKDIEINNISLRIEELGSNYIKYANGILICWDKTQPTNVNISSQWEALYYGYYPNAIPFPQTFLEVPFVIWDVIPTTESGCFKVHYSNPNITNEYIDNICVGRPNVREAVACSISYIAIGRWK